MSWLFRQAPSEGLLLYVVRITKQGKKRGEEQKKKRKEKSEVKKVEENGVRKGDRR